ncbi:transketolase family protein [Nocardia terpenica]|uniref:transketolase family protein n=1 Tax=Nocardia terpenica TaxID=455432 RepID=UPI00031C9F68|nr:transketolase C-terminal domain-containing protein [Nocardia terpenica]NQE85989.1 transketolase family protein [Nocardia terpenica]
MRNAFGIALIELKEDFPELVVLDGDNATSTQTQLFSNRFPEAFLNVGIAEQNMVGIAAGLALAELRPVASAFASMLVNRALDQITHAVAYQKLGVVLVGHYAGLSGGREGACHHSISDIAALRSVPNLSIVLPAADEDVLPLLRLAVQSGQPTYLRLSRQSASRLPRPDRGSPMEGWCYWGNDEPEILIVTCGPIAAMAVDLQPELGANTGVLNIYRMKPFPDAGLWETTHRARAIVTVEEHSVVGGLGSMMSEWTAQHKPVVNVPLGIADEFTVSGDHSELLKLYGISPTNILNAVHLAVHRMERGR